MKRIRFLSIFTGIAVWFFLLTEPMLCQHVGGAGAAPGGGAAGAGTAGRTTLPTTNPKNTPGTLDSTLNRHVFLSGKVQLEDGSRPPEPVLLERVCNGRPRPEGYSDSKGRFSIQLGEDKAVTEDASYDDLAQTNSNTGTRTSSNSPSGMGKNSSQMSGLSGCDLRASLAGFRSDVVNLTGRRILDSPDVGTIILHRLANVEGTTISATTLMAPKDARKAYEKAQEAVKKGKTADAEKEFDKAVGAYPQFAAAWYERGLLHEKQNEIDEARKCYSQALTADPKLISPYLRLAQFSAQQSN